MLPIITVFNKEIPGYGLMAVAGIAAAILVSLIKAKKYNTTKTDVIYLCGISILFSLAGAKLFYIIQHINEMIIYRDIIFNNFNNFFTYISTGYVFYGGLIGGILGLIFYSKIFKVNAVPVVEDCVSQLPLFHSIGRIGCLLAGCCYGIHYDGFASVTFSNAVGGAPAGIPLFPTQLISSIYNLIIFFVITFFEMRKKRKSLQGFGLYLILYSVGRFIIEFFRGDNIRGIALGLSTSQWICFATLAFGLWLFFVSEEKNFFAKYLLGKDLYDKD